jgi:pyridinium-3,5-bisthiocarboxylic acid mononucleotide nickel chelatase
VIQDSALSDRVKTRACAIFSRLAEAEGQVHGSPTDKVQFHEVGGTDAIVDIVGAAIGLEQLGIESVYASPLPLGSGFIRSAHGLYPVPGPATANLLRGVPVYTTQASGEMVTPTGAAIITSLAQGFGPMPAMTVESVGYGAGTRQREFPNVLRGFIGESYPASQEVPFGARTGRDPYPQQHQVPAGEPGYHEAQAVVIETNIDDMSPQLFEHLSDLLLAAGALDVVMLPVQMKKGRPGMLLHVLAYPTSVDVLLEIVFSESTSIGARTYPVTKHMLQRETRLVETPYGRVRLKLAWLGERLVNVAPEYEDCREIAYHKGVPLKEVISAAMAAARQAIRQPPAAEDSTQPG